MRRKQAKSYEDDKSEVAMKNSNTAMLQVDFAENFAEDEVQSALWKQNQITLFTSVMWFSENIKCDVTISDHLKHDKTPIVFMGQLFYLKNPDINTIKIWSDGPNSQFKNKYVMGSLDLLSKKHDIDIIWNFSATSHGKGAVDGVGATVKREANQKTLTRRNAINNLDDFEMAVLNLKNIKITKISEEEVYERAAQLDLKELFENARAIPKITQCHFVKLENGSIRTKLYISQVFSLQDEDTDNKEKNVDNTEVNIEVNRLRVGKIVAVHLRGKKIDMTNVYMAMVCAC